MSFFNELLNRKVPQILGSYLIASITLIGALDWLASRYELSDTYVSIAIFCLISISPSVMLLAYFHGTPGKDEWVKVEKFGIPLNILFIASFLILSNSFDLLEPKLIDNIDDNFLIMISSNNQFIENSKKTDEWAEIEKEVHDYGLINDQELSRIIKYISTGLKRRFINNDIKLHFPETITEIEMLTKLPHFDYMLHCRDNDLVKEKENFTKNTEAVINHFNSKYFTNIDKIIKIDLYWFVPKEKQHLKIITFDYTFYKLYKKANGEFSVEYSYSLGDHYDVNVIDDDDIESQIFNLLYDRIMNFRYGKYVGTVNAILDSNLVAIKLSNLDLIKGINLKSERIYTFSKDKTKENLDFQIKDYEIRNEYFMNNKEEILNWSTIEYYGDTNILTQDSSISLILIGMNNELDSIKNNYSRIIDKYKKEGGYHRIAGEFDYSLEILNIQDSIATAKITKFPLPFVRPRVGDRMRLEE